MEIPGPFDPGGRAIGVAKGPGDAKVRQSSRAPPISVRDLSPFFGEMGGCPKGRGLNLALTAPIFENVKAVTWG